MNTVTGSMSTFMSDISRHLEVEDGEMVQERAGRERCNAGLEDGGNRQACGLMCIARSPSCPMDIDTNGLTSSQKSCTNLSVFGTYYTLHEPSIKLPLLCGN